MSKEGYESFVAEIPIHDAARMSEFQEIMDQIQDEMAKHIQKVAKELGISESQAGDIVYLRGRSRWTQELEGRILRAFRAGHNITTLAGEEEEQLKEVGF